MVHAGTHVDLDYPRVEVFVYHEVVPHHLEEALFTCHTPLTGFDAPDYYIFYLFLNIFPVLRANELAECLHVPHGVINNGCFMIFLNRVVGEVHELVVNVIEAELITTKSDITFFIEPYHRRVVVFN